jgi:hypothetical protein
LDENHAVVRLVVERVRVGWELPVEARQGLDAISAGTGNLLD